MYRFSRSSLRRYKNEKIQSNYDDDEKVCKNEKERKTKRKKNLRRNQTKSKTKQKIDLLLLLLVCIGLWLCFKNNNMAWNEKEENNPQKCNQSNYEFGLN